MVIKYVEKTELRSIGFSSGWTKESADGKRTYTSTADGGTFLVKFKDGSIQYHPEPGSAPMKAGTKATWDSATKCLEVEEIY